MYVCMYVCIHLCIYPYTYTIHTYIVNIDTYIGKAFAWKPTHSTGRGWRIATVPWWRRL